MVIIGWVYEPRWLIWIFYSKLPKLSYLMLRNDTISPSKIFAERTPFTVLHELDFGEKTYNPDVVASKSLNS